MQMTSGGFGLQQALSGLDRSTQAPCEVLVPNVVYLALYTPTPSVTLNPPGAKGWQGVANPV